MEGIKQKMKVAIYAGTFDPITNGHLDVIERSLKIFDELIIAVAAWPKKTLFSVDERIDIIREATKGMNVQIEEFQGLLVKFAQKKKCKILVRGLRAISDFEFEFQMAGMNRKQDKDIDTVFIMTNEIYSFLSSSSIKEVTKLGGEVSGLVPKIVEKKLKEKFG